MANSRTSGQFKEYATVDTLPTELGYFTNEINVRELWKKEKISRVYFSIREEEADSSGASDLAVMTVTLQFRCEGDLGWQDYVPLDGSILAVGNRVALEDTAAGVWWRAGVKYYEYTSGSVTFGFDW